MNGYPLGREGSKIASMQQLSSIGAYSYNYKIPTELDYLFHDIVQPQPSTDSDKIVSYLVHYYPKLKNADNVKLLTQQFLKCPLFFKNQTSVDFNDSYRLVECYKFIIDTKFQVSVPSISFYDFYAAIYEGIRFAVLVDDDASWKVLPIIAGCLSSKQSRNEYNTFPKNSQSIKNIDKMLLELFQNLVLRLFSQSITEEILSLAITCLACIHDMLDKTYLIQYLRLKPDLPQIIITLLILSPKGLSMGESFLGSSNYFDVLKQRPVLRQMNRFAFLHNNLLSVYPNTELCLQQVQHELNLMQNYSAHITSAVNSPILQNLTDDPDKWLLVKYNFFAFIIIFEGITMRILNHLSAPNSTSLLINQSIIKCLFHLSFITDQIGTGGFETLNFVIQVNNDILSKFGGKNGVGVGVSVSTKMIDHMTMELPPLDVQYISSINQSKISFMLQTIEAILPSIDLDYMNTKIVGMVEYLLNSNKCNCIIESTHSLMLAFSSLLLTLNGKADDRMLLYASRTILHFPEYLSQTQMISIISQVAQLCESDPILLSALLDMVHSQAYTSGMSPLPVRTIQINGKTEIVKEKYFTRKVALIGLLISLVHLIDINEITLWLDRIKNLLGKVSGERDIINLWDALWSEILLCNKYYQQKGQLALNWWWNQTERLQSYL